MDIAVLLLTMFFCFLIGVPIAYSLALAAIAGAYFIGIPLEAVMLKISDGVSKVAMLTIPFFVLAGAIMAEGGMARRLVAFADRPDLAGYRPTRRLAAIDKRFSELLAGLDEVCSPDQAREAAPRGPLTRPDGTDPDGFSQRVAAAYREAIATSSTPAVVLAAEAGVPVTTVHRWVRDARRAGHLPAARKGRAA